MKKTIAVLSAVWLVCGVFNYGALYADTDWKRQNDWPSLHHTMRDEIGIVVAFASMGPLGLPVSMFGTNFLQHGWYLTARDVREHQ